MTRVAPKSAAFTVRVPLLPQESVTTAAFRAEGGELPVGLAAGEDSTAFRSILPRSDALELVATASATRTEHWRFEVAPSWHVDFTGVPAVAPEEDSGAWTFEYYPRPGRAAAPCNHASGGGCRRHTGLRPGVRAEHGGQALE